MPNDNDRLDWVWLFLNSFHCGNQWFLGREVLTVNEKTSLPEAFKILLHNRLLAVPVIDSKTGNPLSVLSMLDVVGEIVSNFSEEELKGLNKTKLYDYLFSYIDAKEHKADIQGEDMKAFMKKNIGSIDAPLDPVHIISENESLYNAVQSMVHHRAHRILVIDSDDKLCNVITQSRVVNCLLPSLEFIPKASKSLKELNIGFKEVVTISQKEMSYKAFKLMKDKRISAVAVVDENDKIIGNISVNDMKLLGYDLHLFAFLSMSVQEYLKEVREKQELQIRNQIYKKFQGESAHFLLSCNPTDSFGTAIRMLSCFQVHRLYIVDDGKPVGVLSLHDVLEELIKEYQ